MRLYQIISDRMFLVSDIGRDKMMGKILLTEASGYIGSHLKDKLKVNHEIIAISRNAQNKKMKKCNLEISRFI